MNRQKVLLLLVGILILIKFGFGALNEKRRESRELLEVKIERFEKGKALLEGEGQLDELLSRVDIALDMAKQSHLIVDSSQNARLDVQRRITTLAEQNNITIDSSDWSSPIEGQPERIVFDIRFSGNFDEFAKFHLAVEELGDWVSVQKINVNVQRQNVGRKAIGVSRGSMLFDVVYLVVDS
jgi:Tfp pilus assembly protein PilO